MDYLWQLADDIIQIETGFKIARQPHNVSLSVRTPAGSLCPQDNISHFHLLTGKVFYGFETFPKCHRDKVSDIAFISLKDVNANIPSYGLIIGNCALVQEFAVCVCFGCRHSAMPHSHDHCILQFADNLFSSFAKSFHVYVIGGLRKIPPIIFSKYRLAFFKECLKALLPIGMAGTITDALAFQLQLSLQCIVE